VRPFLRPVERGKLAPVGWVSEPAGQWGGREVDVVYDPRRHDVLLVRNDPGDHTRRRFADAGYRRMTPEGDSEMWVRDRVRNVTARLDRLEVGVDPPRVADIGRRSL
jgi:hypothetical protein